MAKHYLHTLCCWEVKLFLFHSKDQKTLYQSANHITTIFASFWMFSFKICGCKLLRIAIETIWIAESRSRALHHNRKHHLSLTHRRNVSVNDLSSTFHFFRLAVLAIEYASIFFPVFLRCALHHFWEECSSRSRARRWHDSINTTKNLWQNVIRCEIDMKWSVALLSLAPLAPRDNYASANKRLFHSKK